MPPHLHRALRPGAGTPLGPDKQTATVPRDPLAFLREELDALPPGPEGYILINTTGIGQPRVCDI